MSAQEMITAQDILRQSLDRNRYFYGKLMTVRDFTQEQQYFNAKRLVINRLLFGSGVICGLQVQPGSGSLILEIKPGVALDPLGREVTVLEVPGGNKIDLSKVIPAPPAGFTGAKDGFICLAHSECPKDPVPSLKSSPCDETCESNRWSETFSVSWDEDTGTTTPTPGLCAEWLNRVTATAENAAFTVQRTAPGWVRADSVFEVVVRITARQDATTMRINESRTGGSLIEPTPPPAGTSQFPAPPVNLKAGEFVVYVYQIKAPATAPGSFDLNLSTAGMPPLVSHLEVVTEDIAIARETNLAIENKCSSEPAATCIRIASLTAHFTTGQLDNISNLKNLTGPRFRYSLERVTEMLDCLRASLLAKAGSARPGHAFITFNDLEKADPKPVGAAANVGVPFTAALSGHVHPLLRHEPSGLEFFAGGANNELWINGDVGGERINFLNTVKGQRPTEAAHLATKGYVDEHIAGLDWQESVLDKDLVVPPAGGGEEKTLKKADAKKKALAEPVESKLVKEGERYLLFNEPKGDWSNGKKNDIATFTGNGWEFTTPDEGTATFVEDENIAYLFVDGSWIPFLATPEVSAGDGLVANGAVLSVGQGNGLVVNTNDVAVNYDANQPQPITAVSATGLANTTARGDHAHALALALSGGLEFTARGLRINGRISNESNVEFQGTVSGPAPTTDNQLATKKYVDDHASTITAGDGLVRAGDAISVGAGPGINVQPDSVAVTFQTTPPAPIGPVGRTGTPTAASPGDHVHALPLADSSGLVLDDRGLRIDGAVGGERINFLNPVAGRDPRANEHLATKKYVDDRVVPPVTVIAGKGLIRDAAGALAVGQGEGLLVAEDSVAVRFFANTPAPDSERGDPGREVTAARGDHSHPWPAITPGASTGKVDFTTRDQTTAVSESIDPKLGSGPISVQLALVTDANTYVFSPNSSFQTESAMDLSAEVSLGTISHASEGNPTTTFRILVFAGDKNRALPPAFEIRWFAYAPWLDITSKDGDPLPSKPPELIGGRPGSGSVLQ